MGDLPLVAAQPYFLSAEMTFRNDEMGPLAYLSLGYEGVPLISSDSVSFDLMTQIMGTYDAKEVTIVPPQISGNRHVVRSHARTAARCPAGPRLGDRLLVNR